MEAEKQIAEGGDSTDRWRRKQSTERRGLEESERWGGRFSTELGRRREERGEERLALGSLLGGAVWEGEERRGEERNREGGERS